MSLKSSAEGELGKRTHEGALSKNTVSLMIKERYP
jgi:hypothetical protein